MLFRSRAQVQPALELALARLRAWGVAPQPRAADDRTGLFDQSLALDAYETGRPSEAEACRVGDVRFLGGEG